jgi:pyruvate/2-oxoglutarate/acetoin dehydrogenase E1 component/TPP-dependent pyruvate/acetoin dehydrogenase alpha subunit
LCKSDIFKDGFPALQNPIFVVMEQTQTMEQVSFEQFRTEVLQDYTVACLSREVSLLGRKEVLTGKAKFGIFGDGQEVAQVAMARFFKPGDFRSGYYRDQTFMFASKLCSVEQFFAQLYAHPDLDHEPFSMGRQMNAHFATQFVNDEGEWMNLAQSKNISSDVAPTAGQMVRGLGLAYASKKFREVPVLKQFDTLSNNGNEICFCTIGDASTSEGHFWETVNAAGVLQVPLAIFVWDNGFGISVPKEIQTTKGSISEVLQGFQQNGDSNGLDIYKLKGWDYAGMCEVLEPALQKMREKHIPAIFHVEEMTQPQGHSTSGSHERYKSPERLAWEKEWDCLKKMRDWMMANVLATSEELNIIEEDAKRQVQEAKKKAWDSFQEPIKEQVATVVNLFQQLIANGCNANGQTEKALQELQSIREPMRRDVLKALSTAVLHNKGNEHLYETEAFYNQLKFTGAKLYSTHLFSETDKAALKIEGNEVTYNEEAPSKNGFEILNEYFDALFSSNPKVIAFGEDLGHIGDVNQGFAGLQQKHGAERIFDTGIRELTIMGQALGLALRGLRPIAEIQYLDYLLYGLQPLSDDVSTTHWRTGGQQSCPLIVRTRGHRLEGIWHSGSPMGMIVNSLRGMHVCVPRNMVQAIGMYNTLLQSNDPGLVIECLNGYRLKEKQPNNLLTFTQPLGVPEVIREGTDITVVSYGSTLRIVMEAAETLETLGISCEVVDVQTLLPFDVHHAIVECLKKTNRIVFVDEDVPGGAAAYMFNKVMEEQGGYRYLDVAPRTITGKAHRPAYGSDGDYFCKPNVEEIIEVIIAMNEE